MPSFVSELRRRKVHRLAAGFVLTLLGCGGGGGSGGGLAPSPPPANLTLYGNLTITQSNVEIIGFSVVMAEATFSIAQTVANEVVVFSSSSGVANRQCQYDGSASISHNDADSSFSVSAGDSLTVVYDQCFGEAINGEMTGTIQIEIADFMSSELAANLQASVDIPNAMQIVNLADPTQVTELTAGMDIEFSIDPSETLVVSSAPADEISITVAGVTEAISDFELSRITRATSPAPATNQVDIDITFDFSYDSGFFGGTVTCETDPTFALVRGNINSANVLCRGYNSTAVNTRGVDSVNIDPEGDGVFALYGTIDWYQVIEGFLREPSGLNLDTLFGQIATQTISLATTDVFYDVARDRLLVTTSETDTSSPNAIAAVSLSQGTQTVLESFAMEPSAVTLSADGALLYVGFTGRDEIRKYDATTMQLLSTVNIVSNDVASNQYGVLDLAVSPIAPNTVAATFNYIGTGVDDVTIFADDVQLPGRLRNSPGGNTSAGERLFFSEDGSKIHSYYQPLSGSGTYDMAVDATGVIEVFFNNRFGFDVELADGRMYANGYEYDADTYVRLGSFGWGVRHVAVDTGGRRFYSETYDTLEVWDLDRHLPVASLELGLEFNSVNGLVMAGNYLVFLRDNDLRVLETSAVEPMIVGECVPTPGQTSEGDAFTQFACDVIDAIYDPFADRIYAAVTNTVPGNGNSIAVVNPGTETVETYIPVPSNPKRLLLSADGTRLYISFAEVELLVAIDTSSRTVVNTWQLGVVTQTNGYNELDPKNILRFAASPLEPDTIVAVLAEGLSVFDLTFVAFRNGARLPDEVPFSALKSNSSNPYPRVLFDSIGGLHALHTDNNEPYLESLLLTPTGLASTGAWFNALSAIWFPYEFSVKGSEVFFAPGDVVNIANQTVERRFDYNDVPFLETNAPQGVHADPAAADVWFLTQSDFDSTGLARFDNLDGTLTGADEFPFVIYGRHGDYSHSSIFNVGTDQLGLVIDEREGVLIVDKSAIELN